jgi:alkylresorcinol/alkylpyrone synthase
MVSAHLSGIAAAMPPGIRQQAMWDECFGPRYAALTGARRIWNGAGVDTRHAAIDPRVDDVSSWSTSARMQRFLPEALPLATRAVTDALIAADVQASEIDLLVAVSCTGYATPGLDLMLAHELAMPTTLQRLNIGHMGCYAALPGLAAAGDATVAVVVRPDGPGLRLIDTAVCTDASHQSAMTWHITDLGFRMTLSPRVPAALATAVAPTVEALLRRHGLDRSDIAGWAIHPGGPRILDVCEKALALDDDAMAPSRETLRDHGNCSSGTVLLVLQRLLQRRSLEVGDHVVALAFGPGLTLYASLLQWT